MFCKSAVSVVDPCASDLAGQQDFKSTGSLSRKPLTVKQSLNAAGLNSLEMTSPFWDTSEKFSSSCHTNDLSGQCPTNLKDFTARSTEEVHFLRRSLRIVGDHLSMKQVIF